MVSPVPTPSSRTRRGAERDRVDRRLLELVVARDLGPDLVQVGLGIHVELGAHGRSFAVPPVPLISIGGMAAGYHSIDLSRFALRPGEGRRLDLEVDPGQLSSAASATSSRGDTVPARLDLSRTAAGYAVRMRFTAHVAGPCMRCLEDADVAVEVDAREVDQPRDRGRGADAARTSTATSSTWARWAHDALALALPDPAPVPAGCRGLCPVCGASLNEADPAEHRHEPEPDPRWAKLRRAASSDQ